MSSIGSISVAISVHVVTTTVYKYILIYIYYSLLLGLSIRAYTQFLTRHVAHTETTRNVHKILVWKPDERIPHGKFRHTSGVDNY
jgi:hypothetical protein